MTERCGPASGRDQTDTSSRECNLSRNDRTRHRCVRSWHRAVFGHHLTVEIGRSAFEVRDDVAAIRDWTLAECVRLPRFIREQRANGSIRGGSLFKPHGQLKLTLLVICIDIATF